VCRRRRVHGRRRLCVLGGAAGKGRVHVLLLRRRRWKDQRRKCRVGWSAGVSPPASVTPAAALRVEGDGGKGTRAHASAPPPVLQRPAADVSGGDGRWRGAAGVAIAGGGSAFWRERRERETCTCYWSAAGVGKTGGGRVGCAGALVCRRRRLHGRRRLCVLGGAAGKERVDVLPLRRRRWKDWRRTCRVGRGTGVVPPVWVSPAAALRFGVGGRQGRGARATDPPPALARPAADLSGGEGRWCVAAGVCIACGGSACWGGRRKSARARAFAPPPALARPAADVSGWEGRWRGAAGVDIAGGGSAFWRGRRARETCTCY